MFIVDKILLINQARRLTMLSLLKDYPGKVEINGVKYNSIQDALSTFRTSGNSFSIRLLNKTDRHVTSDSDAFQDNAIHQITVKAYMTRPATVDFDFMLKNNNVPMPLRTMVGTIEKETHGTVYMKLHGDITSERTMYCLCCRKPITNPVSQYFGMGPKCGGHNYVNPFYSREELEAAVHDYRENVLKKITWEGWIIKSAIVQDKIIEEV